MQMLINQTTIRSTVLHALLDIAPDLEGTEFKDDELFREAYDLDSADYLNFVVRLHELLGIDIPETDYPKMATLGNAVAYLSARGIPECAGQS